MYLSRGQRLGVLFSIICCTVLVGWIIVLWLTLHRHFTATHWRLAWVGFDIVLLAAFAVTGWAFWRGRRIVITCLLVTGTLLCCDAWFDVILDLGTSGMWMSIASAVIVELPIAFLMFSAARRLIRLSILGAAGESGELRTGLPLWQLPLLGEDTVLQRAATIRSDDSASPGGRPPGTPRQNLAAPDVAPQLPATLACRPWQPISQRKPQLTPLSKASPRARTRGCARS